MGSNPVPVTTFGRLAQLGERLPYKQDVSSSILLSPTIGNWEATHQSGFFSFGRLERKENPSLRRDGKSCLRNWNQMSKERMYMEKPISYVVQHNADWSVMQAQLEAQECM